MDNLEQGREKDTEPGRGVGDHRAGGEQVQGQEHQRKAGAAEADVKARVEQVLLVIEQLEFQAAGEGLALDLAQFDQPDDVHG